MKMSLIFQNVSTSSSNSTGKSSLLTVKMDAITPTAQSFNQTLGQILLGEEAMTDSSQTGTLMSQIESLLSGLSGEEGNGEVVNPLFDHLLEDINQLDDVIAVNPSLLAELQSWLQQVQTLLNGVEVENESIETVGLELPELAQHSDTIRFAVQDALTQLLTRMSSDNGNEDMKLPQAETRQLLALLQSTVAVAAQQMNKSIPNSSTTGTTTSSVASIEEQGKVDKFGANNNSRRVGIEVLPNLVSQQTVGNQLDSSSFTRIIDTQINGAQESIVAASTSAAAAQVEEQEAPSIKSSEQNSQTNGSMITTAGEMALRDNGIVALKPAAPPSVPVEQFAKQMSGFVVSKMDIIKLQGVSEAKISLYPQHLGQVDVKIMIQNGQLTAQFMTEHAMAKDFLEQQMSQLRVALQTQGLQVEKLEVTQSASLTSHMSQEGRQPGNNSQKQSSSQQQRGTNKDALIVGDLSEEWNNWIQEGRLDAVSTGSNFTAEA